MNVLILGYIISAVLLALLFLVQRRTGNAAIADAGWSGSIALLVFLYALAYGEPSLRTYLIAGLAIFWAVRLTQHVLIYRVIGKPEDGRYTAMKNYWGARAQRNMFWFFQGQTVAAFAFSLPALLAITAPRSGWNGWEWLGLVIWLISVGGEMWADHQLEQFRGNPANRGKTCRVGWWRYSRHPNYFFEWIHWFAYIAFAVGHPLWWTTWLAPAIMLLTLFKFTGIPYTERQAIKSRGDDYREYQRTTSVFVPWPPKS